MSITVIALVVWLLLLFLSVIEGIEQSWLKRLTSLHAPLRIQPTEQYFSSYYYNIDTFSEASRFTSQTIGQKASAPLTDPYNPEQDAALPPFMPAPEKDAKNILIDPVKRAYEALGALRLTFQDYEISGAMMRLRLVRTHGFNETESLLTQVSYLASLTHLSPTLPALIIPPTQEDLNQLHALSIHAPDIEKALQLHFSGNSPKIHFSENPALSPPWTYLVGKTLHLPSNSLGTGVLLAKNLQDSGVKVGDSGFLAYGAPTASSIQEQRIPIYVAGFYDPGVMNVGNRCILVPPGITRAINASQGSYSIDRSQANGLMVWIEDLNQAEEVKKQIENAFKQKGIADYWKVTTFREYDFAKDLVQQFESDKLLFTLIGTIILIVACCNIISLLILLVNSKKREIGVLQAMGAPKRSIAAIFGLSGAAVGLFGSLLGVGLALLTLHHIDSVVQFLSFVQGHEAFNALFFGKSLPRELSVSALTFVLITTPLLAFFAGLIPAIQACRLKPSEILKSP